MKFDLNVLKEYINNGLLDVCYHDKLNIAIYNYSRKCQFDKKWDGVLLQMRGMVLDSEGNIVARTFPKFFNFEELDPKEIPNEPFEMFEKADGSLGILFNYQGEWIFCTKGSFYSEQAIKGFEMLKEYYPKYKELNINLTYCFEIIYPENRIVVDYSGANKLILLSCFSKDGDEYTHIFTSLEQNGFELIKNIHTSSTHQESQI